MKIKFVAAVVDTKQLTLYREDGETLTFKQGDPRLRPILDQVMPQIISKGYAELEISDIVVVTGYEQFQKQSGVVRFFKVARDKLAGLFAPPVAEAAVGQKPSKKTLLTKEEVLGITGTEPVLSQSVIDEIMTHAQPITDAGFTTDGLNKQGNIREEAGHTEDQRNEVKSSHTIVAQVGGKLIPDMERIETHFSRAAKMGSTVGVERFLQRLAGVIDQRSHSVEDLLKFMERADMPIADDGSIIIYKVLRRKDGHYVDCHSKKVPQKVGSYVCMDISLVDRNRNNECSNGLHVARRGYIKEFSGDVCTMGKLAPEDVITVPTYDANKMRVMGYHILVELPDVLHSLLKQNKPITERDEGKELLGKVLAGHHIPRLEEVRITQQLGGGVVITPLKTKGAVTPPVPVGTLIAPAVPVLPKAPRVKPVPAEALANPETERQDTPVNPKDVVKNVASLSRKDQAQKLFKAYQKKPTAANKQKLVAFKKSVKLGWKALGIDESELK